MAEPRPFPPSPRRLALARLSGRTWASSLLVGGAGLATLVATLAVFGGTAARDLGAAIAAACNSADGSAAPMGSVVDGIAARIVALVMPLIAGAALAAIVAHVAQTRTAWFPRRRRVPGAPVRPAHLGARAGLELLGAIAIGAATLAWLWQTAPSLAQLTQSPVAAGEALLAFAATLAIVVVSLGVLDALVRKVQLDTSLRMTRDEKREDDRLSAADPRWRARQLAILRDPDPAGAVAQAAVVLIGDDVAIAIAWDPTRQPLPIRSMIGRRARATQLAALARRYRTPIHRDTTLANALAGHDGPVPDAHWPRLADIFAAVRRRPD